MAHSKILMLVAGLLIGCSAYGQFSTEGGCEDIHFTIDSYFTLGGSKVLVGSTANPAFDFVCRRSTDQAQSIRTFKNGPRSDNQPQPRNTFESGNLWQYRNPIVDTLPVWFVPYPNLPDPPPLGGSMPMAVESARVKLETSSNQTNAPPLTVPFRTYGLPISFSAPPSVFPSCNGQLNPSAFVIDTYDGTVWRMNLCTGAQLAEFQFDEPYQAAATPDGRWGIVTDYNNPIFFIDLNTNKVSKTLTTPTGTNPYGIDVSPDGSYALVTNVGPPTSMWVVDVNAQAITGTIPLGRSFPQSVRISRDGTTAWVNNPADNVVDVIDILTALCPAQYPWALPTTSFLTGQGQSHMLQMAPKTAPSR